MQIFLDTKIYIMAPSKEKTGGPELLHQLAHTLIELFSIKAFIYYLPTGDIDPINGEYKKYNIPYVTQIEDDARNIIISPEITPFLEQLKNFSKIRKIVWWLSIDNFYISYFFHKDYLESRLISNINFIFKKITPWLYIDIADYVLKKYQNLKLKNTGLFENIALHLTNSHRGTLFLRKQGIEASILSEYLNDDFFLQGTLQKFPKEDIVAFNPKKGYHFTSKIIRYSKKYNLRYIAIENMNREQVIETLKKAKAYIDFGNHPGKDRLPREAAILGCCVITGKRGSAKYYEDVPIPDKFKFKDDKDNIGMIVHEIYKCIRDYDTIQPYFNYYRECIKKEKRVFIRQIKSVFRIKKESLKHGE